MKLSSPPRLTGGSTFDPLIDYITAASSKYIKTQRGTQLIVVEPVPSNPAEAGATNRKYQLAWCMALARVIAEAFLCTSRASPSSPQVIFIGEPEGAKLAAQVYAEVISEIERYTAKEYVRRYSKGRYHDQPLRNGWRRRFIANGTKALAAKVQGVLQQSEQIRAQAQQRFAMLDKLVESATD